MTYQERIADIRQQGGINFHFPIMKNGSVKPGLWSHICYSYDSSKRHLIYIHNGAIQFNYTNVPLALEVDDGLPRHSFNPSFKYPNGERWDVPNIDKACNFTNSYWHPDCVERKHLQNVGYIWALSQTTMMGYVTDLNLWSRSLSIEEMIDWTTCKSFEKGDLLPWNRDDWTPVQVDDNGNPVIVHEDVTVESDSFCVKTSPNGKTYTMFPDQMFNYYEGFKVCQQFGGTMAHTRTIEEDTIVRGYLKSLRELSAEWKEVMEGKSMWYRYNDNEEEGVWRDFETGFIASYMNCPKDPNNCYGVIPWNLVHEPEGGRGENCAGGIQNPKREVSSYDLPNMQCQTVSNL